MNAASSLKIEKIHTLVTVDDEYRVLHDVDVLVEGDKISAVGADLPTPPNARVLDGRWCVAYPGFVNTHHHFYQTLTRNIPAVQNAKLFDWLLWLYEVWRGLHPEAVRRFRDEAFVKYFSNPRYLDMAQRTFGGKLRRHIEDMLEIKIERKPLAG